MQGRPATSVHRTAWTRLHNEGQVLAPIRNTRLTADIGPSKQSLHFNPLKPHKRKAESGQTKKKKSINASAEDWNIFAYLRE